MLKKMNPTILMGLEQIKGSNILISKMHFVMCGRLLKDAEKKCETKKRCFLINKNNSLN